MSASAALLTVLGWIAIMAVIAGFMGAAARLRDAGEERGDDNEHEI
jgi:hypothetical protein